MKNRESIHNLAFENMTFAYDIGGPVFQNLSFEMPKSPVVWLRAQNSRGKSTLLKIMAGLLTPQTGRYLINGQNVSEMSFEQFLPYRINTGYGFDMFGLLNNKTLAENLILPLQYHELVESDEASRRVNQLADRFGLHEVRNLRPFSVSGSQRKLTCVLRAFVHFPEVVFLDDPTIGLKQESVQDLFKYIEEGFAKRGLKQVYFTAESPDFARRFNAEELMISSNEFSLKKVA